MSKNKQNRKLGRIRLGARLVKKKKAREEEELLALGLIEEGPLEVPVGRVRSFNTPEREPDDQWIETVQSQPEPKPET